MHNDDETHHRSERTGEAGQTYAEYAVVTAIITAAIVFTLTLISEGIRENIADMVGLV